MVYYVLLYVYIVYYCIFHFTHSGDHIHTSPRGIVNHWDIPSQLGKSDVWPATETAIADVHVRRGIEAIRDLLDHR